MQDFLRSAAAKLGIGEDQAASATGGILDMIKDNADGGDVKEMLAKVPGASDLMGKSDSGGGGGGMLGALGGMLGGGAGKSLGGALGLADVLSKTGLDASKLGGLLEMFQEYVQPLIGNDLVKRLLAKIPGIGDLLK